MNSEIYTLEKIISEFTLALLKDNGGYKFDNNYISGLMRFGKNQGYNFLTTDCEAKDISKNNFQNDLFIGTAEEYYKPTCNSGRQSRAYNANYNKYPIRDFQYSGKKIEDYYFENDLNGG